MRGKAHKPELKAAVLAALVAGQGVSETAKQYKLDPSLVGRWKRQVLPEFEQEKKHEFGQLLADYLAELLRTAIAQQKSFADEAWLKTQNAADLAVLHGVSIDKGVRLFEAAQNANRFNEQSSLPEEA